MSAEEQRKLILILGGFGLLAVLLTAGVFVFDLRGLVQSNRPQFEQALGDAVDNMLPIPQIEYDEFGEPIFEDEFKLPSNAAMMGLLERGQRVEGQIGTSRMEGWLLEGRAGEEYTLDFEPLDGHYVWQMAVYGPDQSLWQFTADSDAGYADFSVLDFTLPEDGHYHVILSAMGEVGRYALRLD